MSASRFNASIYARINGSRSLEPMKCKARAALISDSGGRRFTPLLLEFTRPVHRLIRVTPFNYHASKEHFRIEYVSIVHISSRSLYHRVRAPKMVDDRDHSEFAIRTGSYERDLFIGFGLTNVFSLKKFSKWTRRYDTLDFNAKKNDGWIRNRKTLKKNRSELLTFPFPPVKLINFLGATSDRR